MRKLTILLTLLTLSVGLAQAQENPEPNALPTPASNQIYYRSTNHAIVTPNNPNNFGVTVTDNSYDAEADLGTITFSGDVTTIGDWAFSNRTTLTAIVWPSTVTSIGFEAFNGCTKLSTIDLQEGVTGIGSRAFYGCAGMSELTIPSTVTSIGNSAFSGWNLTKLTVKAGYIGGGAFQNFRNLSTIELQEGVTGIGERAFIGCESIAEVTIPSTVTNIKTGAFSGCTNLSTINLQEGVTGIGGGAFSSCVGIKKLIIPSTVTSIENNAFSGCSNVTDVTFLGVVVLNNGSLSGIGTAESPVALKIPSTWLANDKPVNSITPWHGGYFNCEYADPVKEFLGEMAEPCTDCPAVEVSDGTTTVTLYNPKNVQFKKIQQEQ